MSSASAINIENHDQLLHYLRANNRIAAQETPTFETLRGGVSNRTVLLRRVDLEDWVLKQALCEKLRVQVDWFSAPERIQREAAGLRALAHIIPAHVPELLFEDTQHHILAMTAIPQPHENWKSALLDGHINVKHANHSGDCSRRSTMRPNNIRNLIMSSPTGASSRSCAWSHITASRRPGFPPPALSLSN